MVKQSILQIIKNCLEISKKGHSSTHGVNSKSASTGTPRTNTNDQSRTSGKGRAAGATKPDEYLSNVDTQLNKEQSVAIEQERLLETFEYLIEYFFEFYVCRGPGLKQITELNGKQNWALSLDDECRILHGRRISIFASLNYPSSFLQYSLLLEHL